jgi:hypothetical protein
MFLFSKVLLSIVVFVLLEGEENRSEGHFILRHFEGRKPIFPRKMSTK